MVSTRVSQGRPKNTSGASLKTELRNAGTNRVNEEVVCDRGLVSRRNPNDRDAFYRKAIDEFPAGRQQRGLK